MMGWFNTKEKERINRRRMENKRVRARFAEIIMKIADRNMKKAEVGKNGKAIKDSVVVPYDDLLNIWRVAEEIKQRGE